MRPEDEKRNPQTNAGVNILSPNVDAKRTELTKNINHGRPEAHSPSLTPPTIRSLLTKPLIVAVSNYSLLAFTDQCLAVLIPLVYSSSPALGGLNLSSFTIGVMLGVWGCCNGLFNIICLPRLLRKWGVKRLFVASACGCATAVAMFPIVGIVVRKTESGDEGQVTSGIVWIPIAIQLLAWIVAYMGYGKFQSFCIIEYSHLWLSDSYI